MTVVHYSLCVVYRLYSGLPFSSTLQQVGQTDLFVSIAIARCVVCTFGFTVRATGQHEVQTDRWSL